MVLVNSVFYHKARVLSGFFLLSLINLHSLYSQELISGQVISSKQDRMPYVTVAVKNTRSGTFTDEDGWFELVCSTMDTLIFSSVGYSGKEFPVNQLPDLVELIEVINVLDEVVVNSSAVNRKLPTGFGNHKMRRNGVHSGAMATVTLIKPSVAQSTILSKVFIRLYRSDYPYKGKKPEFYDLLVRLIVLDNMPGVEVNKLGSSLLPKSIVERVKRNQELIEFDLAGFNIPVTSEGVFVGIEYLGYYKDGVYVPFDKLDKQKVVQYGTAMSWGYEKPESWIRLGYEDKWMNFDILSPNDRTHYNFCIGIETQEL